ncbi:MAG: SDR family oxidoreductase [Ruminococcus sp.]|nr:SDR family oxidoreductase [Ruminococcus sp.]MDD6447789.1 SDR family oxidoreductase [Ruminococcus sp.]
MKALITGASSGIGRDMARELAKRGCDLILVARRTDRLEEIKNEITGVSVEIIKCDVSTEENCAELYNSVKDKGVDMLVNNAGFGLAGEFLSTDLNRELNMIKTNVVAVHMLTKLFLKDFAEKDRGIILNVASSAAYMAGPYLSTYYATKNYVRRLTEAVYQELKEKNSNVSVSVLCPGPVNTEFNDVADVKFALKGLSSEYVARYAIEKALKGKLYIIPGLQMKLGVFLLRFTPNKLMLKISAHIQKKKQ